MSMSVLSDSTTTTLSPLERIVRVRRWELERNVVEEEAGRGAMGERSRWRREWWSWRRNETTPLEQIRRKSELNWERFLKF